MKKKPLYILILLVLLFAVVAMVYFQPKITTEEQSEENTTGKDEEKEGSKTPETSPAEEINPDEQIDALLADMTLEEKVGQLMVIGFDGSKVSSNAKDMIKNKHIGGIIYFDRNMESPKQVAELSNSLQQTAADSKNQLPLMIGVDQEGGDILRMRSQVSPIPSQQKLGKIGAAETVYQTAKLNATELSAMGVNLNFAPVLDLSKTDSRSFGTDPKKTAEYGTKVIEGFQSASITGAVKHFPGHGRSSVDPHLDSSSVEANQLDLENSDIYPFTQLIKEVDNQNFFVMVTHIKYPAYDKEKPASLSKVIIQDLLRKKLGYEGIVVTDDLEMGAVTKHYAYKDLGSEAIQAGADLLLVCHTYKHQLEVYNGIIEAVQSGEIPIERINEAAKRVISYKMNTMQHEIVDPKQADSIVKSEESLTYLENLK
ncbi:beta-N-acetylhexosaminidase [Peribacillus psychrosaccharolyticus]|uniref:Beta-N-acetylhexosaminidase n=2 Tax=Peribacillus psychrosaccharolyticus TaxID=1407 RepID=A0A974NL43_PERPY|nr:beta-N-acetylhexosaminidase [Peribacillus psychrosaccharolyticus]MED3744260.1 beta-N-acetylhexosaminidase [Peribacillus psychrosaccharolyticus]QQS99747.1 beta-N-acetylhexosaminidase [Peribacillus psychrosaccharolyticus]